MSPPFLRYRPGRFQLLDREAPQPQHLTELPTLERTPPRAMETPQASTYLPTPPDLSLLRNPLQETRSRFGLQLFTTPWSPFLQFDPDLLRNFSGRSLMSAFPSWRSAVQEIANHFLSVDLDMRHLPINNGLGITRFSEWASREHAPRPPLVDVRPGSTASGHGEIRPMAGMSESWITRVNVDFTPDVTYLLNTVPDLYIQEFAAIDPPQITYDWSLLPASPVVRMAGGDTNYENPTQSGGPARTPFGSVRQPPPGRHPYWMFHFNPLRDSLAASLEESVADGALQDIGMVLGLGALNLWAFLPTLGLDNPESFEELGIPFNTFPRRFGDLLELLWPLFTSERTQLRQQAQLINPNTEYYARHYMDAQGRPQEIPQDGSAYASHYEVRHYVDRQGTPHRIPTDSEALAQLNRRRQSAGLAPIRQGEWRPLPREETALAELNAQLTALHFPELTHHRRRSIPTDAREVLRLDEQIWELNRREGLSLPEIPRNRGSVVDWIGLALARDPERLAATPQDQLPEATFRAQMRDHLWRTPFGQVQVNQETQFTISYQLRRVTDPDSGEASPQFAVSVRFHPLDLGSVRLAFNEHSRLLATEMHADALTVEIPNLSDLGILFGESELSFNQRLALLNASVHLEGVDVSGLRFGSEAFAIGLDEGHIQSLTFRAAGDGWRMGMRGLRAGNLSVEGEDVQLQLSAPEQSQDLFIMQNEAGLIQARLAIHGGIEAGALIHNDFGTLNFTTQAPATEGAGRTDGQIRLTVDPSQPRESLNMTWNIPYLGIWTGPGAPLQMARGDSHIRDAGVRVSPEGIQIEGILDLNARMPHGFGEGPTQLFESTTSLDSRVEDLRAEGQFLIQFADGDIRIEGPNPERPLNLSFDLADATFHQEPQNLPDYVQRLASRQVIQTDVGISHARVTLEDFRHAEIDSVETEGITRRRLTHLDSGPLTVSDIQGEGSIWVNVLIWGFVRGLFPHLGDLPGGTRLPRQAGHPDLPARTPLVEHLSPEIRGRLDQGDFLRIGGVRVEREDQSGAQWTTRLDDVILHLHEEGERDQFGLIRIPQIIFGRHDGQFHWEIDPNYLLNVFLNSPPRGGSFRFVRWPREE